MVFSPARRRPVVYRAVGAERRHRQRLDRIGFLAFTDDVAMNMTRHRPRAHGRAGDGGADGKALRGQDVAHRRIIAASPPNRWTQR